MRYDSLLNSKKWPSGSPKGSATPCFLPPLSVLLLCFLPNHPFSNLNFSGLGQPIFLKFHFAVSKCSKFNNRPTFSWSITDLIHFIPPQTLYYFVAFWVVLASTKWPLHFEMVLSHFLEHIKLPYLIWKRIFRSFIWPQLLKYFWWNKPVMGWLYDSQNQPS